MSYQEKYFKYKNKYLNLKKQVGGNKFKLGDTVKRIGSSLADKGSNVEAVGMVGIIKHIDESSEWPPQSGKVLPKQYFIHFPDLYKGTKHDGVLLGVPEEDLELVVHSDKFKLGDTVKRIGSSLADKGSNVEAVGMVGVIKHISESSEWPPQSGTILPKQYFIHFPDLYKGTKHDGVLLGVPEEDLELVVHGDKFKHGDRFYYNEPINGIPKPTGTVSHKRNMYGDTGGGTYLVKYDNPLITEHNAYENYMVKI